MPTAAMAPPPLLGGARRRRDPEDAAPPRRRSRASSWVRYTLWVLVAALLGGLAGAAYGRLNPIQYQVRSDILIESDVSLTGDLQVFEVNERDVVTQRSLLASPTVAAGASERSGLDLGEASTSTTQDSNIVSVEVVQPTRALATTALEAYVGSYLDLVAGRQRLQLESELAVVRASVQSATDELTRLDGAVGTVPVAQQAVLLSQQSAQRTTLAAQQREAVERAGRLEAALARVPVNLQRIDEAPVPEPSGLGLVQWALLGLLAGATSGMMVVLRVAERRR